MQAPLDVTVLRSGIPDTMPGRSVNVCERGIGVVLAGEVVPGESVGVEVLLFPAREPLRARALVRYQDKLRCGLEFVGLSPVQRTAIRDWAKETRAGAESNLSISAVPDRAENVEQFRRGKISGGGPPGRGRRRPAAKWVLAALVFLIAACTILWWKWNRGWQELESGGKNKATDKANAVTLQVPAEVMQKLIVHRVEPVYPQEARKQDLQGVIAVDIVVGQDGSVVSMRALNGPDILANAAMDGLRWWKFEPYRVNGEPVAVETTVAIEFNRPVAQPTTPTGATKSSSP